MNCQIGSCGSSASFLVTLEGEDVAVCVAHEETLCKAGALVGDALLLGQNNYA